MIVRRVQADPKAIWAGGKPQASFATLRSWVATSKPARTPSRLFDLRDSADMGGNGCRWEERARQVRHKEDPIMEMGGLFASCRRSNSVKTA